MSDWNTCAMNAVETCDLVPIFDWHTCIMNAVEKCDSVQLKRLMCSPEKTNLNFYDTEGHTPLIKATIKGNVDICRLLLHHGADVYVPAVLPGEGQTALFYAVCQRNEDIANLLLQHGPDLGTASYDEDANNSPVHQVIFWSQDEMFRLLRHCKSTDDWMGLELLFNAALQYNKEKYVVEIMRRGFYTAKELKSRMFRNCTPFYTAAYCGMVKVMRFLIMYDPQVLQEEWLVQGNIPNGLRKRGRFVLWLKNAEQRYRKNPPSLKQLSKTSIVRHQGLFWKVASLPLPKATEEVSKTHGICTIFLWLSNITCAIKLD